MIKTNIYNYLFLKFNMISKVIYPAQVISIDDTHDSWKIKCMIRELKDEMLQELPDCYPLLGKQNGSLPKEGETVMVLLADLENPFYERYWLPKQNSLSYKIGNEFDIQDSMKGTIHSRLPFEKAPSKIPNIKNLYPESNKNDRHQYWLLGEKNTDIVLGDNYSRIRTNKTLTNDDLRFNQNLAIFLQKGKDDNTTTTVLGSNRLILSSHNQPNKLNRDLTDENIDKIFDQMQSLVRGEELVKLLKLFRDVLLTHSHKYHNLPPDETTTTKIFELRNYNFNLLLNEDIKIN